MNYFLVFSISFVVVFLIIPNIRYIGLKFLFIDKKDFRKIHSKIITSLGGLGIFIGTMAGLISILAIDRLTVSGNSNEIINLAITSTIIMFLGVYDDFQGSSAFLKLSVQTIASLVLIKSGFLLKTIFLPFDIQIHLGVMSVPLTILWLLAITNAINLIDGLDGLASGIVFIAVSFISILSFINGSILICYITLALAGSNLAFLKFNFHPAKIFMGDSGSLFLGFIVGSIVLLPKSQPFANIIFVPVVFAMALPLFDTLLAICRRLKNRQYIFRGDASHIHHFLLKKTNDHKKTVVFLYKVGVLCGISSCIIFFTIRGFSFIK